MSEMQEVYDVKELAEFLHCSVAKIYDMRDRGEIKPIKHYRPMSFSKKEVCRLIEKDEEKETKRSVSFL